MRTPPTVKITAAEFQEFLVAFCVAVQKDPKALKSHWRDRETNALIVSLDKNWQPFVCHSIGMNAPNRRIHLRPVPILINRLIPALRDFKDERWMGVSGGRIFIGTTEVWRKDGGQKRVVARISLG